MKSVLLQELIQQLLSVVEEQKNQMKRMDEQANKEIADCAPLKAKAEHERRMVTDPAYRAATQAAWLRKKGFKL